MARQPQVPGGTPPAASPAPTAAQPDAASVTPGQISSDPAGRLAASCTETLEQKVARLEAENQALLEAASHRIPPPEPEAPESTDDQSYREKARGLRAKDVDATRLKRAVLTQDGWVCPATIPAPKGRE